MRKLEPIQSLKPKTINLVKDKNNYHSFMTRLISIKTSNRTSAHYSLSGSTITLTVTLFMTKSTLNYLSSIYPVVYSVYVPLLYDHRINLRENTSEDKNIITNVIPQVINLTVDDTNEIENMNQIDE